jgi:aspartate kinase
MKVFKFGGASVKNAEAVKNVANVLAQFKDEQLLIVISAMGKTTNALEKLANAYFVQNESDVLTIYQEIKSFHDEVISGLLKHSSSHTYDDIENLFIELECLLETKPEYDYSYNYDQIVSYGEMLSTKIVSAYLNESGIKNRWMDARNFISTDNTFREGKVDWAITSSLIDKKLRPIVQKQFVITQGFIGQARDHSTTTLGREGSDYSAAIFAYGLHAENVTIWKDVAGVMNGDPKKFPNAVKLDELSYSHAIEMAYYGATVIHPKTIQPLQSRNIPLYVKSFLAPEAAGTLVSTVVESSRIPTFISKQDQYLISISSRDFSFIVEENLSRIFSIFASHGIRMNLMQNSAISFTVCVDDKGEEIDRLRDELSIHYQVRTNTQAELVTVMNYDDQAIQSVTKNREVLMEQRTRSTIQFVIK